MSVIKQPSEIQEKKNLVMMVYGAPGIGKSTVAMSAPSPVLIDTDGGVGRTHTAHRCPTVQVTKWEDVQQAMEPLFTTKPQLERSGMGFAFMEAFMDELEVESVLGQGTTVRMSKKIGLGSWIEGEE